MKKIFAILVLFILILSLLTACGGTKTDTVNNASNPSKSEGGNITPSDKSIESNTPSDKGDVIETGEASITPVDGWEKDNNAPYPEYTKDGAKFTIYTKKYPNSYPAEIKTIEEYEEYIIGTLKANQAFASVDFSDITTATVGGFEARTYSYTFYGETSVTYDIMTDDGYIYTVGFSYSEGEYDTFKADIENMLNSYTIG